MNNRYILVGGNLFGNSFCSLSVIGSSNTIDGIKDLYKHNYDRAGGLLLVVDAQTGKEASIEETLSNYPLK